MARVPNRLRSPQRPARALLAIFCAALLVPWEGAPLAQQPAPAPAAAADAPAPKLSPDQLDSLVAPIALYPDPLLAQTLVASTYPLEIIQLQQWLAKNKDLKDKALEEAVAKQPWDPSIQSMASVPEVVKRLGDDIQWTTSLGNAFLEQQSDVMDAVQRMRAKAQGTGALKSTEQQTVETQVIEQKTVIIVEPTDPQVIYVPTYSPVYVYPPPIYPYPPIYYPPAPVYGAALVGFTAGIMIGAAIGGPCCGCRWGGNNVNINVNNNFNRNANINTGGNNNWQHNSQHRGGAPYSNQATANKYGGSAQGGARSGSGGASAQGASRSGSGGASATSRAGGGAGAGAGAPSASNRASSSPSASGAASRSSGGYGGSSGGYGGSSGGFGGGSGGYSGSSASAASSRGASSMSSGGGGYRGGGGGGRGGGGRR